MVGKHLTRLAAAGAVLTAVTVSASALELRLASGAPPSFPANDPGYTTFIEVVEEESGGAITARQIGMEVANLTSMVENLQNGTIDVGNIIASYFPAQFPHMMLLGELSVFGEYGNAMTAATTEFMMTCPECQEEMKENGIVYLASWSTSPFELITVNKPIRSLDDVKGMRLRSTGANTAAWMESLGAVAVNIPFNEEYQALASGLADGTLASPSQLLSNRLIEVANYYTQMPVLTISTSPNIPIRTETWTKLSLDERRAVVRAAAAAAVSFEPAQRAQAVEGIDALKEKGGEVIEPSENLVAAHEKFREEAISTAIERGTTTLGIPDAEEKVRRYAELIEKWNGIIAPIQDDEEAMAQAMWDEIYSKIDLSTYGE